MTKIKKKILIDTVSGKEGGIKTLIANYLYYLKDYCEEFDFTVYVSSKLYDDLKSFEVAGIVVKKLSVFSDHVLLRIFWELFILPFILIKYDALYSITCLTPFIKNKKTLLLIHQPNLFVEGFKKIGTFYKSLIKISCHTSEYVIVQTEYIKNQLRTQFLLDEKKIKILPQGVSFELKNANQAPSDKVKKIFELQSSKIIFLLPSLYAKHKNFEKLIQAFSLMDEPTRKKVHLFITAQDDAFENSLKGLIEEKNLNSIITNLGVLSQTELAFVYKNSNCFIFPSLLESFGLPMIEAMYFSLPILVADLEYARNVCGDCAIYFNPYNEISILESIMMLVNDKSLLLEYSLKSKQSASRYSWESHVKDIIELIK